MSQAPISWSAMANEAKDIAPSNTIKEPTVITTTTEPKHPQSELSPYIADADDEAKKDRRDISIEDEWKAEPFEAFKQGVAVVFLLWEALQLIIQQGLVTEAEEMSDFLEFDLIQVFIDTKGKIGPEDLEIWLNQTMEQNFYTQIEDGSCIATAKTLVELYQNCMIKKDFTQLGDLMQKAFDKMNSGEEGGLSCYAQQVEGDDDFDEDWDEDYEDWDEDDEDVQKDGHDNKCCALNNCACDAVEQPEPPKPKVVVDEDGFKSVAAPVNARAWGIKKDKKKK